MRCWLFHKWNLWSEFNVQPHSGMLFQMRRCDLCNKIQKRWI